MGKLPTQLKWSRFKCVLKLLGYEQFPNSGGSARTFHRSGKEPETVTFHEPHGSDTIRQGTLTEYLRKLEIKRDEFEKLLNKC